MSLSVPNILDRWGGREKAQKAQDEMPEWTRFSDEELEARSPVCQFFLVPRFFAAPSLYCVPLRRFSCQENKGLRHCATD